MLVYDIQLIPAAYFGTGVISGLITANGEAKSGFVVLLMYNNRPIRETVSDATGAYAFYQLDTSVKYDVVAQDPSGTWETKVSSRRIPLEA